MKAIGKHKNIIEYIEFGKDSGRIIEGTTPKKIKNYLAL